MKVCFVIPSLGDGGAQRQCIALLNELQYVPDVQSHLVLFRAGEHDDSLDTTRLAVHRTEVSNFASPAALTFLIHTLRRVRPDVLVSWLHPADILAYTATRLVRNVRWIMTERDSAYPDQPVYNIRKKLGCRASVIVANSQKGKEMWESLNPSGSVVRIPNIALSPPRAILDGADRKGSVQCIAVGRLEPQKNIRTAALAFAAFAATEPEARLVIVGAGSESGAIERMVRSEGLADRVSLLGFRNDVPELMSRARVLLSLSLHEGMPNVVMEAVAAGLPAVVSDIPEHRAVLGEDYPYYVPLTSDMADVASVIARAWADCHNADGHLYDFAQRNLTAMSPGRIVAAYLALFTNV